MLDWDLAQRIGSRLAGSPDAKAPDPDRLIGICAESVEAVVGYTGLIPEVVVPPAEVVSRQEWVAANVASLGPLLDPVIGSTSSLPGGSSHGFQVVAAAVVTVEAGAVLGAMSRKVLGQYDLSLVRGAGDPPPRLLFVGPNLGEATVGLGADGDDFVRWVAVHEVTHAVQFGSVPWLRDHLGAMATELVESLSPDGPAGGDANRGLVEAAAGALRQSAARAARFVSSADPRHLVVDERQTELLDRIQAAMAMVEGHAEHVMDHADTDAIPSLPRLRRGMAARRRSPGPIWKVLGRVLGLELKMKQYLLGREFCDRVVDVAGMEVLNLAWSEPSALPDLRELESPHLWLRRVMH